MEKDFVPYDRAFRMKALGFDEPCFGVFELIIVGDTIPKFRYNFNSEGKWFNHNKVKDEYNNHDWYWSAPTFSQAFIWFDENTEWSGFIVPSKKEGFFDWWIQNYTDPNYLTVESDECYVSRKEAELACLDKLLEIVESKSE